MARLRAPSAEPSTDNAPRGRGHKRRASAASIDTQQTHDSIEPDQAHDLRSSPALATAYQGRKKRTKHAARNGSERLTEEPEATFDNGQQTADTIIVAEERSRHVRFSDPGPNALAELTPPSTQSQVGPPSSIEETSTVSDIQPTRSNRAAVRHSLSQTTTFEGETVQFVPLRTLLEPRVKRRLRRSHLSEESNAYDADQREARKEARRRERELEELRRQILQKEEREKELLLELESQRQWGIEITEEESNRAKLMEEEIARLRQEITHQKAQHEEQVVAFNSDAIEYPDLHMDDAMSEDDSDEMILINPDDLAPPQEEGMVTGPSVDRYYVSSATTTAISGQSIAEASTQVSLPDPTHESEILEYQEAVRTLHRKVADYKAALNIISVELRSLGFTSEEAESMVVLQSIRSAFREARLEAENLLPGSIPSDLQNGDILEFLLAHIKDLLQVEKQKCMEIGKLEQTSKLQITQTNSLLNKISEMSVRNKTLETIYHELDSDSEQKSKTIVELEEELGAVNALLDTRDEELANANIKIQTVESEIADKNTSIDRYKQALQGYRDEISGLEALITRMESDHTAAVAEMKEQHAAELAQLQDQLHEEQSQREAAEANSDEKSTFITDLEGKIEKAEAELDEFRQNLQTLCTERDSERTQREAAEEELQTKNAAIAEWEDKVERADAILEDLRSQLSTLSDQKESEHRQREVAENELDEKNTQIEELDAKLHEKGTEANQLRQKMFELQQDKEAALKQMQEAAAEREDQYQNDMAAEIDRREAAERTVASKGIEIAELQEKLEEMEQAMQTLLDEKNEAIASRDAKIEELEYTLRSKSEDLEELQNDKRSLEKRVEDEAAETLKLTASQEDKISDLERSVRERDDSIMELENTISAKDAEYTETVNAKDRQIETVQAIADARSVTITHLSSQLEAVKDELRQHVEDSKETIEAMLRDDRTTLERNEARASGFLNRSSSRLSLVENIKAEEVRVQVNGQVTVNGIRNGSPASSQDVETAPPASPFQKFFGWGGRRSVRGKRSSRAREVRDSGIGVDDETSDEVEMIAS